MSIDDPKLIQARNDVHHAVASIESTRHHLQESIHRLRHARAALRRDEKLRGVADHLMQADQRLERAMDEMRDAANIADKAHKEIHD